VSEDRRYEELRTLRDKLVDCLEVLNARLANFGREDPTNGDLKEIDWLERNIGDLRGEQ